MSVTITKPITISQVKMAMSNVQWAAEQLIDSLGDEHNAMQVTEAIQDVAHCLVKAKRIITSRQLIRTSSYLDAALNELADYAHDYGMDLYKAEALGYVYGQLLLSEALQSQVDLGYQVAQRADS